MSEATAPTEESNRPKEPRRRALVTGASSGIGRAFSERLARDGYDLVVVARSRDALEVLAKELSEGNRVGVEVLVADLTRREELLGVEAVAAADPGLDLLVNNAGFGTMGPFAASEADTEENEVLLNVVALQRLTRAALPRMVARGRGAIVNVSSMAALTPNPYFATYGATKAFVNSFTEALHEELRGSGVKFQALCPGFTRTDFQRRANVDTSELPSFVWMEADRVVDASLAALEKGGVVCVPGAGNRAVAAMTSLMPRSVSRRIVGATQSSRYGK